MRFARTLVLAALLAGPVLTTAAQEAAGPQLHTFLREAHSEEPEVLGRRIASRGAEMAPAVFQALRDGTAPLPENGALIIGPAEEAVLLAGVRSLGRPSFAVLFGNGLPEELDSDTRRALLQILGEVGKADDAPIVVDLVLETDPAEPKVVEAFERAVAGVVGRDVRALGTFRARFLDLDDDRACALARAVASQPSHAGVELLVEMIGYRDALDLVLLSLAGKAARELDGPFDEAVRAKARQSLTDPDFQVLRKAASTAALLQDFEATEALVELLDHDQKGVRDSAHWALCQLTGLELRPDPAGWLAWYETELRWYQEEAPGLKRLLVHGSPVQIVEALGALGRHRYDRHATALAIAEVLEHDNPRLRLRACAVLRQLGSTAPVPALVECLEDEEDVASEAHQTLRALTGRDLPNDATAWHDALAADRTSS